MQMGTVGSCVLPELFVVVHNVLNFSKTFQKDEILLIYLRNEAKSSIA
jgi:hypothetical protein